MGSMSTIAGINSQNVAKHFTPRVSIQPAGITPERTKVWLDVPKEVRAMTEPGSLIIDNTCLKENAQMVLELYEDACLQHVIDMQIKDKTFSKLMRGNPTLERKDPGMAKPGKRIAKSSLLGQDPWGDKEIPPADADSESSGETYTQLQTLLKNIQDDNYVYLTTHIKRILHEDIYLDVRIEENKYELNTDNVRTNSKRNRMEWKRYKEVIYELLPMQIGLHELRMLMALNRENHESAQSWVQRLTEGKRLLEKKGIKLPDLLYVQIAIDYLTNKEKTQVSERIGTVTSRAKTTKQKLMRKILDL